MCAPRNLRPYALDMRTGLDEEDATQADVRQPQVLQSVGAKQVAAITVWLSPQLTLTQAAKPGPAKMQGPAHAPINAMQARGPASACFTCKPKRNKATITNINTFLFMVGVIISRIVFCGLFCALNCYS